MMKTNFHFFLFLFFFLLPQLAFADVSITEIMFDAPGGDDGHEWIEIFNSGETSVDLSVLRLREAETNHKLTEVSGGLSLAVGGFAVIASDPAKFTIDFPSFSGLLLDSSFSLSNTGEMVSVRDGDTDLDSVSYLSDWGAKGDGNSLQKIGGEWKASLPTPGKDNGAEASPTEAEASVGENPNPSSEAFSSSSSGRKDFPVEPQIFADAGKDKTSVAGQTIEFLGKAWGLKNEPLLNAKYGWTFGDGGEASGIHVIHTFRHVGTYVVVLNVSSGEYSASDRLLATVSEPHVSLTQIKSGTEGYIEVSNLSSNETDLSFWGLQSGGKVFSFPSGTILLPKSKVRFENSITGLDAQNNALLLFQNGSVATRYLSSSEISQASTPSLVSNPVTQKQEGISSVLPTKSFTSDNMVQKQNASVENSKISNLFFFRPEFLWVLILLVLFPGGSLVWLRRNHESKTSNDPESFEIIEIPDS